MQPPRLRRIASITVLLVLTLALGFAYQVSGLGPQQKSRDGSSPLKGLAPSTPSKEYIYLGDRLLATDEPTAPPAAAPAGVSAASCTASRILLTWTYDATTAAAYSIIGFIVERRESAGSAWLRISTSSNASQRELLDTQLAGSTSYTYRVAARSAADEFGFSAEAAATTRAADTFTDDPLQQGMIVRAGQIAELRTAVDTLRSCAGLPAGQWSGGAVPGGVILAVHLQEIRTGLGEALDRLGLAAPVYTDSVITAGLTIKADHVGQLRNALR